MNNNAQKTADETRLYDVVSRYYIIVECVFADVRSTFPYDEINYGMR